MNRLVVKHSLLDRGMTLFDLAAQCGITYDRIIKIVNGYRVPRREEIDLISRALSVSPERVHGSRWACEGTVAPSGPRSRRAPSRSSRVLSARGRSRHQVTVDRPRG